MRMDSKQVKELLQKYWDCQTSLEEEKLLRDYFCTHSVTDDLKDAGVLFQYFHEQQQKGIMDVAFDSHLKKKLQPSGGKIRSLVLNSLKIAAGISVVVASVWLVRTQLNNTTTDELVDTYDDPKKAFEETKRALQLISKNFGKAEKASANINLINEATEKLQEKDDKKKIDS
jgi:hypothetical protein